MATNLWLAEISNLSTTNGSKSDATNSVRLERPERHFDRALDRLRKWPLADWPLNIWGYWNFQEAFEHHQQAEASLDRWITFLEERDLSPELKLRIFPEALTQLADYQLREKKYPAVLATFGRGAGTATNHLPLLALKAHALLLSGNVKEAGLIYLKYADTKIDPTSDYTWQKLILERFSDFERRDIKNPDFGRIRELLNQAGKKPNP